MTKALTSAQNDLEALRAELEAWITSQPVEPAKPAAKRTRAQLIAAATTAPIVPAAAAPTAAALQPRMDFNAWMDYMSTEATASPVELPQPVEVTASPVEATASIPTASARRADPASRKRWRDCWRDGHVN